jgi:hypothetical protein
MLQRPAHHDEISIGVMVGATLDRMRFFAPLRITAKSRCLIALPKVLTPPSEIYIVCAYLVGRLFPLLRLGFNPVRVAREAAPQSNGGTRDS